MSSLYRGVTSLHLVHFRSYRDCSFQVQNKNIVIYGENGVGKTNVLEALSLLVPGRGLRNAKLGDIIQKGENFWVASAALKSDEDDFNHIGVGIEPDKHKRVIKINQTKAKSQFELSDYVHAMWLTPSMDQLFQGNSSERRRFFDRIVYGIFPHHAESLSIYNNTLKERCKVLNDYYADDVWLLNLENVIVDKSIQITKDRLATLNLLNESLSTSYSDFFPRGHVELTGEFERLFLNNPLETVCEDMKKTLIETRPYDKEVGGSRVGPHKGDFKVTYLDKEMEAAFCSTGEQKILLISLVLSAIKIHILQRSGVVLLLLDEVAAHLDENRREILFNEIDLLKIQTWVTGTDRYLFDSLNGRADFMTVQSGQLISQ